MRINATLVSVQSAKASSPLGQLAAVPIASTTANGLVRVGLPADIADDAVVTKADLVFHARAAYAGTRDLRAQRNVTGFKVSSVRWGNRPDVTGVQYSVTVGAVPADTEIRLNLINDVQSYISGAEVNRGWRITSSSTTPVKVWGATAAEFQPYLDLEYLEPGGVPANLSPDGAATSLSHPTLTFTVGDPITALRVQVDPLANGTSPSFDSGTVATTGSAFSLAGTTYSGLALNASTSWRVQVLTALGWTEYSSWATFTRTAKSAGAIAAPESTSGDTTPPFAWTFPGQAAWQADLLNATGKVVATSGRVASADTTWTPPVGLAGVGSTGTARLRWWDAVNRVATPGDPTHVEATQPFTVEALSTAAGATALTAVQGDQSPVVTLTWLGVDPDKWQVVRDGVWLPEARIAGTERRYQDWTAIPNREHTYQVLKIVDGLGASPNGPVATIRPACTGIWLIDVETSTAVAVLDNDPGSFAMDEQAVIHEVLGRGPVRRRTANLPPVGSVRGGLYDWSEMTAEYAAERLLEFKEAPSNSEYRLVLGDMNILVTIGDVAVAPVPESGPDERIYAAGFSWWQKPPVSGAD